MTPGFIFWNNRTNNSLNLDTIKKADHSDVSGESFDYKYFSEHAGIAYSKNLHSTHVLEENDEVICYSPSRDIHYKQYTGNSALLAFIDDYQNNGEPALPHIRNSFSVILMDKANDKIIAAIDKFGINRLYYHNANGNCLISNNLNTLVSRLPNPTSISNQAIFHFIGAHVIPSPQTIYKDIFKLEPAQAIRVSTDKTQIFTYWEPEFSELTPPDNSKLEHDLRQTLSDAVNGCGIDDTTGAFLSGGLDSSTVAGYMATNNPDRSIATYTMGFSEAGYDETEFAEIAAKYFGTNLRHYYVTPDDIANVFSHVISNCDEPFGNSSIIPAYLCAKFAYDDSMRTLLAGDGGDELFAGNERYAKQQVFEHYAKTPGFIRKLILEPIFLNSMAYTKIQPFSKIKSYIEQAITPMPTRMERYSFINHFGTNAIFNKEFIDSVNQEQLNSQKAEIYNRPQNASMLNRMLYIDWKYTLADNDLVKVNTACQLAGIKVKYPMLDDGLLNLSLQIPSKLKMHHGELRSFYKSALKDFLPNEIINKKKHGFGLPFGEWLKKSPSLQEKIYDNLTDLKKRGFIDTGFIDNIIETHRTQQAASYYGTMVWILAVLEEWLTSRSINN